MAQVSSIKVTQLDEFGRSMTAFRIFPPYRDELGETEVGKTGIGRDIISDHERLDAFLNALENATPEEVELARPALLFHLEEFDDFFGYGGCATRTSFIKDTAADTVRHIGLEIANDARKLIRQVDASPRSKAKASRMMGCMAYLAEVLVISNAISMAGDADFEAVAQAVSEDYVALSKEIADLRTGIAARYPETAEILVGTEPLLASAADALKGADLDVPHLTFKQLGRLEDEVGDRDTIFLGNAHRREEALAKGWYRPLDADEAEGLRENFVSFFRDVDRAFNRDGFLAEMMACAVALRLSATESFASANLYTEERARSQKRWLYDSDREHAERIEKDIANIDRDRQSYRARASCGLRKEAVLRELFDKLDHALHPDRQRPVAMNFEVATEGVIVGSIPGRSDALVIARDTTTSIREAVYVALIPVDDLSDLSIERVREFRGTNFYSIDDAIEDLGHDGFAKNWFFGDENLDVSGAEKLVTEMRTSEASKRDKRHEADRSAHQHVVPF